MPGGLLVLFHGHMLKGVSIVLTLASFSPRTCRFGRLGRRWWGPLGRRGIDHELEAFFGCGKLGDIMFRVCSPYMLLH